jgi:hypothetical protein
MVPSKPQAYFVSYFLYFCGLKRAGWEARFSFGSVSFAFSPLVLGRTTCCHRLIRRDGAHTCFPWVGLSECLHLESIHGSILSPFPSSSSGEGEVFQRNAGCEE